MTAVLIIALILVGAGLAWTWFRLSAAQSLQGKLNRVTTERDQLFAQLSAASQAHAAMQHGLGVAEQRLRALDAELGSMREGDQSMRGHEARLRESANLVVQRFLDEAVDGAEARVKEGNLDTVYRKLSTTWTFLEKHGYTIGEPVRKTAYERLLEAQQLAAAKQREREEQTRIREQMREEARAEKEHADAVKQADRETNLIERALERALADAKNQHSDEIAQLEAQLAEARAKAERAKSMAQLTKTGHVYVISNIGSFGDGVFKVGMTRRLEPMDRVVELGDASVPFPFDVHMMIWSEDAPKLEHFLHSQLAVRRLNLVNLRREYFRASLDEIKSMVESAGGVVRFRVTERVEAAIGAEFYESERLRAAGMGGSLPVVEDAQDE